jgi:23S rRNA (adenine-N6)-dimethyltransferase
VSEEERTWGWHQLADDYARRLVAAAGIQAGDLVLDVGAGRGAITQRLVLAGARVIAVELHDGRARDLRARFAGSNVRVVRADAADLRLPRQPFRVVANPPFGITTALLRRLLSPGSRLVRADVVVPRYAAYRWAAGRGPGAARWGASFDLSVVAEVPARAFKPPPPGQAAVLVISRRGGTTGRSGRRR